MLSGREAIKQGDTAVRQLQRRSPEGKGKAESRSGQQGSRLDGPAANSSESNAEMIGEANTRANEQAVDQSSHQGREEARQEDNCVDSSRKDLRTNGEILRKESMDEASEEAPNHLGSDDEAGDQKQENHTKRKEIPEGEHLKQSNKKLATSSGRSSDGQADRRGAAADDGERPGRDEPDASERSEGGSEAEVRQDEDSADRRSVVEARGERNGQEASEGGAAPRAPPDDRGGKQDGEDGLPEKKEEAGEQEPEQPERGCIDRTRPDHPFVWNLGDVPLGQSVAADGSKHHRQEDR